MTLLRLLARFSGTTTSSSLLENSQLAMTPSHEELMIIGKYGCQLQSLTGAVWKSSFATSAPVTYENKQKNMIESKS